MGFDKLPRVLPALFGQREVPVNSPAQPENVDFSSIAVWGGHEGR